jgi:hypothetical protein
MTIAKIIARARRLHAIKNGLVVCDNCDNPASKTFADFLKEDDDATTGDVFLQCCLFGEVQFS